MSKIKVIKKNAVRGGDRTFRTIQGNPKPKSGQREMVEAVEGWVTDWRRQAESQTRLTAGELTRIRLKDSTGI